MADEVKSPFSNGASEFRLVAIGVAAENKTLGVKTLKVTPHEKLSMMDGEVEDQVDAIEYKGVNDKGDVQTGTSFVGQTIEAHWLPESNRETAPDIRRTERIELWQFAGNPKWYWRDMGLDKDQRRLETVVYAISADPSAPINEDLSNCYFLEISGHNKTVTFSTSKSNGEIVKYNTQYDMAKGHVVTEDDLGNYTLFDSKNTNLRSQNANGTFVELNKQDINMSAPQNINAMAERDVNITAGNNINITAKNTAMISGGGSVLTLTGGGTTLKTPKFAGSS